MAADTEGDDTRVHLASITDAAEAAAEKTRALLAFHRDTTKTTEKTDIAAVVETVHKALPKLLGDTVHVEISVEPNLWPVMADPEQVERVLVNLVLNARDAMPDGGPLHIRAYNQVASRDAADTASEYAVLQVDDKGTGMTPEVRERVFDPFFTTKPLGEGTGLGMAMVYGVAQRAGGHVEITTEVDKGTSVRVYLPQYTKALKIQSDPAIPVAKEGKETVLLVEDNRLLRIVAARILKAAGYQVAEAGDTESALRVWKQAPDIDAVLTDVIMPGRSGIELADELRTMSPELPIVFMSGHIGSLEHAMKPRDDSTAFIEKPFKADDVLREIRRVIDKRSPAL